MIKLISLVSLSGKVKVLTDREPPKQHPENGAQFARDDQPRNRIVHARSSWHPPMHSQEMDQKSSPATGEDCQPNIFCREPPSRLPLQATSPNRQEPCGLGSVIEQKPDQQCHYDERGQSLRRDQPLHIYSHTSSGSGSPAISRSSDALSAIRASY